MDPDEKTQPLEGEVKHTPLDNEDAFGPDNGQQENPVQEEPALPPVGPTGEGAAGPQDPAPVILVQPSTTLLTRENETDISGTCYFRFSIAHLLAVPIGGSLFSTVQANGNVGKVENGVPEIKNETPAANEVVGSPEPGFSGAVPHSSRSGRGPIKEHDEHEDIKPILIITPKSAGKGQPQGEGRTDGPKYTMKQVFSCSTCSYTTDTRSMLKRHRKIHVGEHQCRFPGCKAMFRVPATRTKHEKDQHMKDDDGDDDEDDVEDEKKPKPRSK